MDAVRQTKNDLGGRVPLLGFAGAPFTLASYVIEGAGSREYMHTKRLMMADEGAWNALLGKIADALNATIASNESIERELGRVSEIVGKQPTAWFVCYAPAPDPQYVVAVAIEQGGHGGESAAPVARKILEGIFNLKTEGEIRPSVGD